MEVALQSTPFFQGVEYLAIFCCGLVGGLAAIRKQYDVFAIIITAWLTALGGGIIRDILLGAVPPVGISDKGSVLTALIAGCVVAVIHVEVGRLRRTMLILDALALGLFAVNGTSKALMYNTSGLTAVFLGTFTAMGGGLIRDILLNEVPVVIRDRHCPPSSAACSPWSCGDGGPMPRFQCTWGSCLTWASWCWCWCCACARSNSTGSCPARSNARRRICRTGSCSNAMCAITTGQIPSSTRKRHLRPRPARPDLCGRPIPAGKRTTGGPCDRGGMAGVTPPADMETPRHR